MAGFSLPKTDPTPFTAIEGSVWDSERDYEIAAALSRGCTIPYPDRLPEPPIMYRTYVSEWEGDAQGWSQSFYQLFADGLVCVGQSRDWDGQHLAYSEPCIDITGDLGPAEFDLILAELPQIIATLRGGATLTTPKEA